jgi:hypothetical protein
LFLRRAQQTLLNRFQQFKVPVGGIDLHFIHEQGKERLSQDLRAKRDSKLTCLTAWIASFVRVPYR